MKKTLIIINIILIAVLYLYFNNYKKNETNEHLNLAIQEKMIYFTTITEHFEEKSNIVYDHFIHHDELIDILYEVSMDGSNKNQLRKKLYDGFLKQYTNLKANFKMELVHFHLPSNKSFLRMHKPNKYGDDLKEIRPIIAKVNKTKMPHTGFEIGRTKVAYRVVYPIFKNEKYLGAIEISFPVQEFMKSFILKFNKLANFQFDKNIIENSVWKDYIKKGYVLSPIYSMYIEKSSVKFLRGYFNNFDSIRPSKQFAKKIVQKSKQNIEHEAIAVYGEELNEIMVLIPIFNHVSNQFIGYFTTRTDGENIALVQRNFWLGFIISSIFTTILLGIIYFIIKRKEDEKIALQEKTLELDKKIEKQNEELKEKNALLEESQDIAKLGAWRLDLISDTLEWSDQVYSIFEIDKEKFGASYEAFLNTIHPEDLELVITPPIKYSNIMI